jgi:hypothetical protein
MLLEIFLRFALLPSSFRASGEAGCFGGSVGQSTDAENLVKRVLVRRWADRLVRIYASAALQLAGFSSAAGALASTPEIVDADTVGEARSRVNAALTALLAAREVPQTEIALVATLAAREALALATHQEPTDRHLKRLVEALHTVA